MAWAFAALVAGLFLASVSTSILTGFRSTLMNAEQLHDAPACDASGDNGSVPCLSNVTATVTGSYVTYGSKGSHHYWISVEPPPSSGSNIGENIEVSYSDYYSVATGTEVPATMWRSVLMTVTAPGGSVYQTPDNPAQKIGPAMFSLLVPAFAVGLLLSGAFIAISRRTPNDVLRDATHGVPQPPRPVPRGLVIAVLGWTTARAMLFYGIALLLEAWWLTAIAASRPTSTGFAPPLMIATVLIVSAFVYAFVYQQLVRDVTKGVISEIPVKWDEILYNKGRPYAAKVAYTVKDGSVDHKTIRARWWRLIHIGTRIHAIASPETGKIWRILGMTNDAGEPVY